jgi:hypothetical protein
VLAADDHGNIDDCHDGSNQHDDCEHREPGECGGDRRANAEDKSEAREDKAKGQRAVGRRCPADSAERIVVVGQACFIPAPVRLSPCSPSGSVIGRLSVPARSGIAAPSGEYLA